MATTDTELQQLVINVGTEAQILAAIEGGTITENMLSISTDGGSSGSIEVDGTTISTNANDELQAIGLVNKNVLTSSRINPIYDWVGTYNEWVTQDVATNHPDWFCYITDDAVNGMGDTNVVADVNVLKGHMIVAFQAPNADNNYTWYRKYADGWVEQGGIANTSSATTTWSNAVVFPIIMNDANYTYQVTPKMESFDTSGGVMGSVYQVTTTGFTLEITSKYMNAGRS